MNFLEKKQNNNSGDKHYYNVYDKNGKFIRTIDVKDEKSLSDEYLHGVTCFVINEKGEVLMQVRADTELTPGKIDLISGHVDGEETPTQAVIRELYEEVGIENIDATQIIKVNELSKPLGFASKGKIRNFFIDFYFLRTKKQNFTIQLEEVESLKWVDMEEAFEMIRSGETKFPKQGKSVNYEPIFSNIRQIYLNKNPRVKKVLGE